MQNDNGCTLSYSATYSYLFYTLVQFFSSHLSGSSVDVKGCVKVVREQEKSRAESLLNALRYTTMHLNDESTPKNIKSLLFDELS